MASVYSPEQLDGFLSYIQVPNKYLLKNNPKRDLAFLNALHTHVLSTVPYENLALHYSPTHNISLEPQHLYKKIVTDKRGRGGYCELSG